MKNPWYADKRSIQIRLRDWLWWRAYHWVFGIKYDARAMAVNDKLNGQWQDGWKAAVNYMKEKMQ